jgi:hypothetical protein
MSLWTWLAKIFKSVKTDAAKIAVVITEDVQTLLKTGLAGELAKAISAIFPNVKNLPQEVVDTLQKTIPKILAAELALQGLPDNPTEQDILDFERKVLEAFSVHDSKSKLYTTLGAQVYGILYEYAHGKKLTFANLVVDLEEAYQDYLRDKAEADAEADQQAVQ